MAIGEVTAMPMEAVEAAVLLALWPRVYHGRIYQSWGRLQPSRIRLEFGRQWATEYWSGGVSEYWSTEQKQVSA